MVRPFTAKWHRQSEQRGLEALDATDVFRAELIGVQQALSHLNDLMLEIRDGRPARAPDRRARTAHCRGNEAAALNAHGIPARTFASAVSLPAGEARRRPGLWLLPLCEAVSHRQRG